MSSIKDNDPASLSSSVSPFMKELIGTLLDKNPENRPDPASLLSKDEINAQAKKIVN